MAIDCEKARMYASIRLDGDAGNLNLLHSAFPGDLFDFRTCEGVLSGNEDFGLFQVKLRPAEWTASDDSFGYTYRYPCGIRIDFEAALLGSRLAMRYKLTNEADKAFPALQIHTCLPTACAPSFRPEPDERPGAAPVTFVDRRFGPRTCVRTYFGLFQRLHLWRGGTSFTLHDTKLGSSEVHLGVAAQGAGLTEWAWWNNTDETFDVPLMVLENSARSGVIGLGFESAIWANANVGDERACFHLFPYFETLAPGESSTVRGWLYWQEGTPADVLGAFEQDRCATTSCR